MNPKKFLYSTLLLGSLSCSFIFGSYHEPVDTVYSSEEIMAACRLGMPLKESSVEILCHKSGRVHKLVGSNMFDAPRYVFVSADNGLISPINKAFFDRVLSGDRWNW